MTERHLNESVRLHRFIAQCGLCSRRDAEEMIREGRVQVNGQLVTEMGVKVGDTDEVRVDGRPLKLPKVVVVIMNKPAGVVTTMDDPKRRPTVVRYLPEMGVTLKPVGRLDMNTTGLLLLTNDGELAARITHPRHGVEKEYQATVKGIPTEASLDKLRKGVVIERRKTKPAEVKVVATDAKKETASLVLVIHEGRYRQVRLMCEAVGHPVLALRRTRVGPLRLKGLAPGECRLVSKQDVDRLRSAVGLGEE